ncbi:TetR/AcrR family transcriptional regulator C-terminal ligand-binding domain-containing protein [Streptomyces sp. Y2F8-2]|uniref:TetR/AcrR family transcriptional regulator C-terminal ligand-binding domain-containing protein n=1 Tax=Streptomyces sp. Y2F8-2 TaxID=2759675 RepID=UPI001F3B5CAF|nr:TetR/AcrR family transcriptional regulator C-terminal ligand-binding domain-containing protein [Streptomyces sp. Y2F8-2]
MLAERWDDEQSGAVLAAVLGSSRHDEGMRRLRESLLNQIADALCPAVTTAVERGQLRLDVTPDHSPWPPPGRCSSSVSSSGSRPSQ